MVKHPPEIRLGARTLGAYVVLWAVLSLLAEGEQTSKLAAALAWSVTLGVGIAYGPQAIEGARRALPFVGG